MLRDDVFSSQKFREANLTQCPSYPGSLGKIRYDEKGKALPRSMVGTNKTFHDYITDKDQKAALLARKQRMIERQSTIFLAPKEAPMNKKRSSKLTTNPSNIKPSLFRQSTSGLHDSPSQLKNRLKGILKLNSGSQITEFLDGEESSDSSVRSKNSMETPGTPINLKDHLKRI